MNRKEIYEELFDGKVIIHNDSITETVVEVWYDVSKDLFIKKMPNGVLLEVIGLNISFPNEYEVKPKMLKLGDYEYPEPEIWRLSYGEKYYVPDMFKATLGIQWAELPLDFMFLKDGFIHKTEENAKLHAIAIFNLVKRPAEEQEHLYVK